jgi:hypothetical protein
MEFISNVVSIDQFIESIRAIRSPEPSVLPLRKNGEYPTWVTDVAVRKQNAKLYSTLKSRFLRHDLLRVKPAESGLYFFFKKQDRKPIFYYIGIADSIKRRLGEHLTRLDYIFYSITYPRQADTYFNEVMKFYGEGLYPDHKEEYERQFLCYKSTSFQSIAWLSSYDLGYSDWDKLETFYVSICKPCVNVDKKDATPDESYRSLFLESRAHLFKHVIGEQVQNGCA